MILEAIVTTRNQDGTTNVAPMGPYCSDPSFGQFELRPFRTSQTWKNLRQHPQGVLHITDNVMLFAMAAIKSRCDVKLEPAASIDGEYLSNCCRCYEFQATWMDATQDRAAVQCRTVQTHRFRDFIGFNRAKHAVIEASILATRVDFLPAEQIRSQMIDLKKMVTKTGGEQENDAFHTLELFLREHGASACETSASPP
ncbi:MAG: DUF447 family protein [Pirellulaceae bacterium]|nr:DUF447 family protein [Pirellulaceae bacterium]